MTIEAAARKESDMDSVEPGMDRVQRGTDSLERHRRFQRRLEDWRRDIVGKLGASLGPVPQVPNDVRDEEERSADEYYRDLELSVAELHSSVLSQIDDALRRLQVGTYGRCTECLDEIAEARLVALPCVRLCRDCQEAVEESDARVARRPRTLDDLMT
jgi:DnaK suppressor protein